MSDNNIFKFYVYKFGVVFIIVKDLFEIIFGHRLGSVKIIALLNVYFGTAAIQTWTMF